MTEDGKITRPWKTIADELTKETDPQRVLMLSQELNRALAAEQQRSASRRSDDPSAY